jgi:hypothetical protein
MSCLQTDRICLANHKLKLGEYFELWWYAAIFPKTTESVLIELHQGNLLNAPLCSNNGTIQSWTIERPVYHSEVVNSTKIAIADTMALSKLITESNQFYFNLHLGNQCLQGPYVTGQHTFVELELKLVETPPVATAVGDSTAPQPVLFIVLASTLVFVLGILLFVLIRRSRRAAAKKSHRADQDPPTEPEDKRLPTIIAVESPKVVSLSRQDARLIGNTFRKELREPKDGWDISQ